jgi:hypothetical protein
MQLKKTLSSVYYELELLTKEVEVRIRVPPAAPMARTTLPQESTKIDGHMDDCGILPGSI